MNDVPKGFDWATGVRVDIRLELLVVPLNHVVSGVFGSVLVERMTE